MEKPTGKKPPAFPKTLEIERTDFHISSARTTAANLTQFKTRKEPFPVRLTFAPFRLIPRLEKTGRSKREGVLAAVTIINVIIAPISLSAQRI
jgi:hypothetical protein